MFKHQLPLTFKHQLTLTPLGTMFQGGHTLPGAPVIWDGLGRTSDFAFAEAAVEAFGLNKVADSATSSRCGRWVDRAALLAATLLVAVCWSGV